MNDKCIHFILTRVPQHCNSKHKFKHGKNLDRKLSKGQPKIRVKDVTKYIPTQAMLTMRPVQLTTSN